MYSEWFWLCLMIGHSKKLKQSSGTYYLFRVSSYFVITLNITNKDEIEEALKILLKIKKNYHFEYSGEKLIITPKNTLLIVNIYIFNKTKFLL